jgi:anti-anti-sigma factor
MQFTRNLSAELAELAALSAALQVRLQAQAYGAGLIDDVLLIIEELIANTIDHGCGPGQAPPQMEVSLQTDGSRLRLEVRDNGAAFDPLVLPPPDLDADILERPLGGLGIHLIRSLSESLYYRRENGCNVLGCVLPASPLKEPTMSLEIEINDDRSGTRTVRIGGRLDTHSYQQLDARLAEVLDSRDSTLVMDLAKLEYISSAGIRSVFAARKHMGSRGGQLLVVNAQPQVLRVFEMVKAVPLGEIFASDELLDAYLDELQREQPSRDDDGF